jgi:hypothetical protein
LYAYCYLSGGSFSKKVLSGVLLTIWIFLDLADCHLIEALVAISMVAVVPFYRVTPRLNNPLEIISTLAVRPD